MTDATDTVGKLDGLIKDLDGLLKELPQGFHGVHWSGNTKSPGHMELSAWVPGWGRTSLIRPARWGMNGARFQFNDFATCMMVDGENLVKFQVGNRSVTGVKNKDGSVYREDIESIEHPVAKLVVLLMNNAPEILEVLRTHRMEVDW